MLSYSWFQQVQWSRLFHVRRSVAAPAQYHPDNDPCIGIRPMKIEKNTAVTLRYKVLDAAG
jgi:hypothetical protein